MTNALGSQHVAHRVQAWLRRCDEPRCPQRSRGEGAPGEGAVDHLDLLARSVEDDAVLADDGPAADGVDPDLALPARRPALPPVDGDVGEIPPPALGRGPREEERRARGRVRLVPVVRFYDLDVVIGAELLGEAAHHLPDQAHPDAHVRGEDDGYALRSFFVSWNVRHREPRGADDD